MGKKELLRMIRNKTLLFLFLYSIFYIGINLYASVSGYLDDRLILNYDIESYGSEFKPHSGIYHEYFGQKIVLSKMVIDYFKNFFAAYTLFFLILFSVFLNKNEHLIIAKQKVLFSEIVIPALIVVIVLTVLYFTGREFIVPVHRLKLDDMVNRSSQAYGVFQQASTKHKDKKYEEALVYYKEYLELIDSDPTVTERVNILLSEINIESFEKTRVGDLPRIIGIEHFKKGLLDKLEDKREHEFLYSIYKLDNYGRNYLLKENPDKNERVRLWQVLYNAGYTRERIQVTDFGDLSISGIITDYYQLADIYMKKNDFTTAWYYYKFVLETDPIRRDEAAGKINEIKNILSMGSLATDNSVTADSYRKKLISQEKLMVHSYELKRKASHLYEKELLKEAFFIYNDILDINPRLREIRDDRDKVLRDLSQRAVEITEISNASFVPGKNDFCFMADPHSLVVYKKIIPYNNSYYLFDIMIYKLDEKFGVEKSVFAPYGQFKTNKRFTLYSYSLADREKEYFPVVTTNSKKRELERKNVFYNIDADISTLYNFSYDYERAMDFSLFKLYELKTFAPDNVEDSSVIKSDNRIHKNTDKNFSMGFNANFIKTAITDKISRYFLFFSISLLSIVLGWNFRSKSGMQLPVRYFLFIPAIPVAYLVVLNLVVKFITVFYSILASVSPFGVLLILCIVVNIIIMVVSIIVVSGTGVEKE